MTVPMRFRQYIQVKAGEECDPETVCPAAGYILPEECEPPDPEVYCPANGYVEDEPGASSWEKIAYFYTNSPAGTTFDPTIHSAYGVDSDFAWLVGGNEYNTKTLSIELDGTTHLVELWTKTGTEVNSFDFSSDHIIGKVYLISSAFDSLVSIRLPGNSQLTGFVLPDSYSGTMQVVDMENCGLTGILDLSMITKWHSNTSIELSGNSGLKNVNFASSITGTIFYIYIENCDLTGILDLSMFTNWSATSGRVMLDNNPNLTKVNFASSITGKMYTISIEHCDLTGTLDLSKFDTFTTSALIHLDDNPNLTGVTFPASAVTGHISQFYINDCDLQGTLDLSSFPSFGYLYLEANADLTDITFAASVTSTVTRLYLQECDLTGTLDLSAITKYGNSTAIDLGDNSNLTGVTFPASITLGYVGSLRIDGTGITSLDVSMFDTYSTFAATFDISSSSSLASLTMPTAASGIIRYLNIDNIPSSIFISPASAFQSGAADTGYATWRANDNGWSAAQVNQFLVELDGMTSSGYSRQTLYIAGTNSAPDGSSGGYDGLTAKSNLESKGWTVYTN